MTPWQYHKYKWKNCAQCDLCERRKQVVLARGEMPCDILFIGEAPGPNENAVGKPFMGPAGQLLNDIINQSVKCLECGASQDDLDNRGDTHDMCGSHLPQVAMTNLVACYPRSLDEKKSYDPPTVIQIQSCSERLMELGMICRPKLIVAVGKLAEDHAPDFGVPMVSIMHPGKILAHTDESQKGLAVKRCVITIIDAIESLTW